MSQQLPKGYQMEEILRRYFIRSGYFVVRGVPFAYDKFDVTDIDLWLYDRSSPVSRNRIVVDAKNKNTPKAIERIFWTKGLQQVLGVEQAIVATTDKRAEVTNFGREHNVLVLDGAFIERLKQSPSAESVEDRLTEEEFVDLIAAYKPTKEGGDWKAKYRSAKIPLARELGYNAINEWIEEARFFAEQSHVIVIHKEAATRLLYMFLSFVAIAVDFVMRELAFSDHASKLTNLNEGFRYGSQGAIGTGDLIELATGLIEHYAPTQRSLARKIRQGLRDEMDAIPTKILAEHFAKHSVSHELFGLAKELESSAYARTFVPPRSLSVGARALLGVVLDFWQLDRKMFLGAEPGTRNEQSSAAGLQSKAQVQSPLPGIDIDPKD